MTNYDEIDFSPLTALTDDEVITHTRVRDIRLAANVRTRTTVVLSTPWEA